MPAGWVRLQALLTVLPAISTCICRWDMCMRCCGSMLVLGLLTHTDRAQMEPGGPGPTAFVSFLQRDVG